jgi:excisionase family DNA binding protein
MMLRPKEVCQRLGISYATVREYVKKGYIKPVLEIGKWRFREKDLEKLMGILSWSCTPRLTVDLHVPHRDCEDVLN